MISTEDGIKLQHYLFELIKKQLAPNITLVDSIADLLEIKEQTIKIHINQIFKELRVFNRTQAVLKAQKFHLLSASTPVGLCIRV